MSSLFLFKSAGAKLSGKGFVALHFQAHQTHCSPPAIYNVRAYGHCLSIKILFLSQLVFSSFVESLNVALILLGRDVIETNITRLFSWQNYSLWTGIAQKWCFLSYCNRWGRFDARSVMYSIWGQSFPHMWRLIELQVESSTLEIWKSDQRN